ncbi:MAG: 30S ribosomal protein S20 [Halothiobacillaceae bacterium]|nr:30S ribosomal protein S20 [Halothiobacillaceae bacterium]
MANSVQAKKRIRIAEDARQRNMALRSRVRTFIKKTLKAIASGDQAQAQSAYREAQPVIDSMVNKGILAKNTAARHKSRLVARIRTMA